MKKMTFEDLKAGTILRDHVYYDDYFIVLPKYRKITDNDIEILRRHNLSPLYTTEKIEVIEKEPEPEKVQKPHFLEPEGEKALRSSYELILISLRAIFKKVENQEKIQLEEIQKTASIIIEYSLENREDALLRASRGVPNLRFESHSLNTGILCTFLASDLKIKNNDLVSLVSGSIMHDVGILLMNEAEKIRDVKKHTIYGFQYLKSIKDAHPYVVIPSIQHHEKCDGSGYPNRITLKDINLSAKIVAICDSCDSHASYIRLGSDISLHITKDELFSWKKADFDPELFERFINLLSKVFENGRRVKLNNEMVGIIRKTSPRFPMHPVIEVLADSIGVGLEESETIELIKIKKPWIKDFI